MPRERLDVLVEKAGLASSKEKAQRLIRAGEVSVDGHPATKPGHRYSPDVCLTVRERPRFVSRGGDKLEGAFDAFSLDVRGLTCLDIGASTGGFTDCLLQHGAAAVTSVDVGSGLLDWGLRNDPRVTVLERVNARYLSSDDIPVPADFAVVDVAFISLTKILPAAIQVLRSGAGIVTLIKPQFEAGPSQVGRGGVVRDPAVHASVVQEICSFGTDVLGLRLQGVEPSPLRGPKGNIEFLAYWLCPVTGEGNGALE